MDNSYSNRLIEEISIKISSFAKYYPGSVSIFIPNDPRLIRQAGWEKRLSGEEEDDKSKTTSQSTEEVYETDLERSVRRSKKTITDLLLCNAFDMFVTITFSKDRHDITAKKKQFTTWLKNQRDRNGSFSYVFVPEFHKDGAIHFHGALKGYTGKINQSFSAKNGKPIIGYKMNFVYEFAEYKSGFTRVEYFNGKNRQERSAISYYITKYITKDMISIAGKKRFWTSQGLNRPLTEFNPDWWQGITPALISKNDFGEYRVYVDTAKLPEHVVKLMSEDNL